MILLTPAPNLHFPDTTALAKFGDAGPQPQVLADSVRMKVLVVGLNPGQKIPSHPGDQAMYHFLAGSGEMILEGETFAVAAGSTVIAQQGATRSIRAETALVFLAAKPQ